MSPFGFAEMQIFLPLAMLNQEYSQFIVQKFL